MVLAKQNEARILELGKQFGMVTPYTSLIVLESLTQYLEYRISTARIVGRHAQRI